MNIEANCPCCRTDSVVMRRCERSWSERHITLRDWHKFKCSSCDGKALLESGDYSNIKPMSISSHLITSIKLVSKIKVRLPFYIDENN